MPWKRGKGKESSKGLRSFQEKQTQMRMGEEKEGGGNEVGLYNNTYIYRMKCDKPTCSN